MTNGDAPRVALVAGGSGIVGHSVAVEAAIAALHEQPALHLILVGDEGGLR